MSAKFNFVIPDDLLLRIRKIAEDKEISVASILNQLISDYVNNVDRIALKDLEQRVEELESEMQSVKTKLDLH